MVWCAGEVGMRAQIEQHREKDVRHQLRAFVGVRVRRNHGPGKLQRLRFCRVAERARPAAAGRSHRVQPDGDAEAPRKTGGDAGGDRRNRRPRGRRPIDAGDDQLFADAVASRVVRELVAGLCVGRRRYSGRPPAWRRPRPNLRVSGEAD